MNVLKIIIEEIIRISQGDVTNTEKDHIQFIVRTKNAHNVQGSKIEKEGKFGLKKNFRFKRNKNTKMIKIKIY